MSDEQPEYLVVSGHAQMEFDDEGFPKVTFHFSDETPLAKQFRKVLKEKIEQELENGNKHIAISFGSGTSWQYRFEDC